MSGGGEGVLVAGRSVAVEVSAPVNIALIKYWGKRDEAIILPINDSVSVTIDALHANTRVRLFDAGSREGEEPLEDTVLVNGRPMEMDTVENRYRRCFAEIRRVMEEKLPGIRAGDWYFQVVSITNFPVQAGLASSAAGFAALTYACGQLFGLDTATVSRIARLGSGSACRSLFEGFVRWEAGVDPTGADCISRTIYPKSHWPNLRAIVLVTSDQPKQVGSTDGMQLTVATSELFAYRVQHCVRQNLEAVLGALARKDMCGLAEAVTRESNQLHAVCLDTYPPLQYLNDNSRHLIRLVTAYNGLKGGARVGYTFDAGPNCCLFLEEEALGDFLPYLCYYCPPSRVLGSEDKYIVGWTSEEVGSVALQMSVPLENVEARPGSVQVMLVSTLGGGPKLVRGP